MSLFVFPLIGRSWDERSRLRALVDCRDNTAEATPPAPCIPTRPASRRAGEDGSQRHDRVRRLGYALYWVKQNQGRAIDSKAAFLWQKFLKFVPGFPSFRQWRRRARSRARRWPTWRTCRAGRFADVCGRGLRTNIRELMKQAGAPLLSAGGECAIAALTLMMVLVLRGARCSALM